MVHVGTLIHVLSWRQQKHQCLCFHYWDYLTDFWRINWRSIIDIVKRLSYTYSSQLAAEKRTSFLIGISNKFRPFLFSQGFRSWLAKNNFPKGLSCLSNVLMNLVFLYQFNFLPIWWRVMTEPAESLKIQREVLKVAF